MTYALIGGLYALGFWVLGLWRPSWILALICGTIFFQQDLSVGGVIKFSIAEVNTMLAIPLILIFGKQWRRYPGLMAICIYLAICSVSSLAVWRATTTVSMVQMVMYFFIVPGVFAALGSSEAACANTLKTTVIVGSGLALFPVVLGKLYVLGLDKNGLGDTLCAALLVGVELMVRDERRRKRLFYAILVACISLGLLATLSRGAWLGALTGLSVLAIWRRQVKRVLRVGLFLLPILAVLWWKMPAESKEYATNLSGNAHNVRTRIDNIDFALEQFRSSPVYGVGVGLRKEYDATNIVLSTVAESGVVGLCAFVSIFVSILFYFWRSRRRLQQREFAATVVGLAVAVNSARLVHGMVDHFWQRGTLTLAWGLVGMAAALLAVRQRRLLLLRAVIQNAPESETALVDAEA